MIARKVRRGMKRMTTAREKSEQEITMEELERVIEEAGMNKAAGEDDIPYEMIKHLGRKAREMLLHIYNEVWAGKGYPSKWIRLRVQNHLGGHFYEIVTMGPVPSFNKGLMITVLHLLRYPYPAQTSLYMWSSISRAFLPRCLIIS